MAATNFTPIILYHSVTASAAPTAGNLNNGELAINITDGKLFYKDNGGVVQIIATKGTGVIGGSNNQVQYNSSGALAGSANFTFDGTTATINTLNLTTVLDETYGGTGLTSYTTGDVIYASGSNTLAKLAIGANTYILTSTGSVPQWSAPSAVSVSTATNLAGGTAGAVPYQSGAGATTFLSIGTSNQVLTSTGSAPQWVSGLSLTTLSTSGNTTLGDAAADNLTINATVTSNLIFTDNTYDIGANGATRPRTIYVGTSVFSPLVDTTNLEVTNIKALDGTAALSIADSTGVVSVSANPVLSGGTANGVLYLNASKVATSGSALTFDGTTFATSAVGSFTGGVGISGAGNPSSGQSVEITFGAAGFTGIGRVMSFDRSGGVRTPLAFDGSYQTWLISNSERMRLNSTSLNIGGNFTSTNNALQVTGNAAIGDTLAGPTDGLYVKGNVGVGTNSPVFIASGAQTGVSIKSTGSNAAGINVSSSNANNTRIEMFAAFTINQTGFYGKGDSAYPTMVFGQVSGSTIRDSMTLDSSGNLGLGVTPSAWSASWKALQVGGSSALWGIASGAGATFVSSNTLFDGAYKYINTGTANYYAQSAGAHSWHIAPSGTAGNAITFTQAMTLHASGGLSVGNTTDPGVGSAIISGNITSSTGDITVGTSGKFLYSNYVAQNSGTSLYLRGATASGQIEFQTNTTTKATLDSSGNLGLGVTPSAWTTSFSVRAIELAGGTSFWTFNNILASIGQNYYYDLTYKYKQTGVAATDYYQLSGAHVWRTAASGTAGNTISFTQAMTLDASGNLGVGRTDPAGYGKLAVAGLIASVSPDGVTQSVFSAANTGQINIGGYNGSGTNYITFQAGGSTERARITSGGYFKASNNGTYNNSTGTYHEMYQSANSDAAVISAVNASFTSSVVTINASRNTTNNTFYALNYYNAGAGAYKLQIADSGTVTNATGTYGTISDAKMKTDIVDAGSQWSDIKALRFRKFKMKDDPSGLVQLGVVAQEVELTSPGLVDEHTDRDAEGNDLGTTTKSVKTSVLLMKAAVALQEAMARIEKLEAEVAALKGV